MKETKEIRNEYKKVLKSEFEKATIETLLKTKFSNVFHTFININENDLRMPMEHIEKTAKEETDIAFSGYFTDEFNNKITAIYKAFYEITEHDDNWVNKIYLVLPSGTTLRQ